MDKNNKTKIAGVAVAAIAALSGSLAIRKKIKNHLNNKRIENEIYKTGRIRKLGTLYLDDKKQKRPCDFNEFTDVPVYMGEKIEIRDTDKNDEDKLHWVEVDDDGRKFLICDRNILKQVSWNELNNQDLVLGKVIILDGKKYILRILSGDSNKKIRNLNEWDRYIVNNDNIEGLPLSTDDDKQNIAEEDKINRSDSENNKLWHWNSSSSFTQNENLKNKNFCIIRGFYSNMYSNNSNKDMAYETVGYRPVLEELS